MKLKNVYEDYPFRDENWTLMRHKKNKKAFAWIYEREGHIWINVKCDPEWRDFWRRAYKSVIPGYHQNKEHWNSIILDGTIPDKDVIRMIEESYDLTDDRITKETTLCYIEKDNKYLMLHRIKKNKDPNKGKWIGVGGKLKKRESIEKCLLREVMEETGLVLTEYQYRAKIYFYSDIYDDEIMYLFTATKYSGELTECNEGELAWIDKSDVLNLNLWEGDKVFLQRLLIDDIQPFVLKLYYKGEKLVDVIEES